MRCDTEPGGAVVLAGRRATRTINAELREALGRFSEVTLREPLSRHNLAVAPGRSGRLTIEGSVGSYGGGLDDGVDILITHNAGWALGEGMAAGALTVRGDAGMSAGAAMHGGTIRILGAAGPRCGVGMWGGTVVVHGEVGWAAGLEAKGGRVVCLADVGPDAGAGMGDAELWVAGSVGSVGPGAVIAAPDRAELADLEAALAAFGISARCCSWRLIRRSR